MKLWSQLLMAAIVAALISPPRLWADNDSLPAARSLYAAAEYEAALAMLDRLPATDRAGARSIAEYRAFCLLALGRAGDAERAIAAVVLVDPFYRPAPDLSPRVRGAFHDVRKRLLPELIQQKYAAAKAAFDSRQFAAARDGFDAVIVTLGDPDVADVMGAPPLSDLRTLAAGFRDLAVAALVPPPIQAREHSVVATPVPITRVYSAEDRGVVAPVAKQQSIPELPKGPSDHDGTLELVIDETGIVESATMRVPLTPRFDELLTAAARSWTFSPALYEGTPVKYRRLIQVAMQKP